MTNETPPSAGAPEGAAPGGGGADGGGPPERPPLRDLVIEAGLAVLDRDGLGLGAQSLTYSQVFKHLQREHGIKVTRASVHERIWASHDDFRRDVVAEAIARLPTNLFATRDDEVRDWIVSMWDRGLDADQRVAEVSRHLGPLVFAMIGEMPAYRDVQKAKAMAAPLNDPLTTESLRGAIAERVEAILSVVRDRMAALTAGLGLRPRRALGLADVEVHELLSVVYMNLLLGAYLDVNSGSDEIIQPVTFLARPATEPAPWTMLAIGVKATINLLYDDAAAGTPDVDDPPRPDPVVAPPIAAGDSGRRRQREELRALVLGAGVEVLLRERMDLRPESLSYASVFAHIKKEHGITVFRSSVHNRMWASHDEFLLDVLLRGIGSGPSPGPNPSPGAPADGDRIEPAGPIGAGSSSGPHSQRQAARDILRAVTKAEIEHSLGSIDYLRRQAIKVALLTEPTSEVMTSLRQAIQRTQSRRVDRLASTVRQRVLPLGYEVRPELGVDTDEALRMLAVVALTSAGGAVFDLSAGVQAVSRTFPIRREPDGTDGWLAPSVAAWACFEQLFQETGGQPHPA